MTKHIWSIDDLSDLDVETVLARAVEFQLGSAANSSKKLGALLFFEPSLRTRTGFQSAAIRLGWPALVEVLERRSSDASMPESIDDTVSVLTAYFDFLLVRADRPASEISERIHSDATVLSAGDRGSVAEHPTQALVDLFATEMLVGPLEELTIAVCGDLRMRSARSLLKLLARRPPAQLVLVTDPQLSDGLNLPPELSGAEVLESTTGLHDIDAIHAVGIPHLAADEGARSRLRIDAQALESLTGSGLVFSPMPVIDEVARTVRSDSRVAFLEQSALGLYVRMAVLESLVP